MIRTVLYLFIFILVLSYFGFDIENFMNSEMVVKNLNYIKNLIGPIWIEYIKPIYDFAFSVIGDAIQDSLNKLKNGGNLIQPYGLEYPSIYIEKK